MDVAGREVPTEVRWPTPRKKWTKASPHSMD
jgi:hypothetical protein